MDLDVERQLAELKRRVADLKPKPNVLDWIKRFNDFRQICAANQARAALMRQQRPTPKQPERPTTHVYQQARRGTGFKLSLLGFDFLDKNELERVRGEYKNFLKNLGIDDPEVDRFEHSWQLATHRYSSPDPEHPCAYLQTGKGFMVHKATWRGALDIRPGSDGLMHWNKHLELKRQADSQPLKKIDYRR